MENKIKIDFNYYKAFYYVAKCGNFSLAAKELGVSQPAVSYTIAELEKALGAEIFIRKGKKIELTKSGENLFDYIDECFNTLLLAEDRILNANSEQNYKITIGIQSHICRVLDSLHEFLTNNQQFNFAFVDYTAETLLKKIQQKELEIALVSGEFDFKDLSYIKLMDMNMAFVAKKEYADASKMNKNDIKKLKFALPEVSTRSRKEIDKILLQNNIQIDCAYEFNCNQMCLSMLDYLNCVYYLPEEMLNKEIALGEYNKLDLKINLPKIPVYVVYNNKYVSKQTRSLIDFLSKK